MTKMTTIPENYNNIRAEIVELLKAARSTAARNVNSIMTATYWEIGRRIVESEQQRRGPSELRRTTSGTTCQRLDASNLAEGLGISISGKCVHFTVLGPRDRFFRHCRENLASSNVQSTIYARFLQVLPGSANQLPFALVRLRTTAFRQEPGGAILLRNRGSAVWLVCPATGSPDRQPILRTHRALAEQSRHAREGENPPNLATW